jgi:hypothetical protein
MNLICKQKELDCKNIWSPETIKRGKTEKPKE